MLTKTYSIPAHTVTEKAYRFDELDPSARLDIARRTADDNLEYDMEFEHDQLAYMFTRSNVELQWDASCCQGSGVNIYGTFSINDLLEFAGFDPIDDEFDIDIPVNRMGTYSRWDDSYYRCDIVSAIDEQFCPDSWGESDYWITPDDDPFAAYPYNVARKAFHDTARRAFWEFWNRRIDDIVYMMNRKCANIYHFMSVLQPDSYLDPDYYHDHLFDERGNFICYESEW